MTIKLSDLLFEKFLEYQQAAGTRKTLKQFAEDIGLGQVYLNRLMNGRRSAGEKTIIHLAEYFKDPRFYDAAGLDRPEALLIYTRRNWGQVPEEVKKKIADQVAQYTTEKPPKDEEK